GVELKGVKAVNPANKEEIPIFVADYVLSGYGTGAIMAVPAHDARDFEFAKKFNLSVKQVIAPECGIKNDTADEGQGGVALIYDPKQDKFAVAKHISGELRLYGGGVLKSEEMTEGILREIREESGFFDFSHIEKLFSCYVHYFNVVKQIYRKGRATCLLLVLKSAEQRPLQLEDHEKFELLWMDLEELRAHWKSRNKNKDYDHWLLFLDVGEKRLKELGYPMKGKYPAQLFFEGHGVLIASGKFDGFSSEEAKEKITKFVGGKKKITYRLRDWLISRQRYWGCPIPIVYDSKGNAHPIPDKHLPWLLPEDVDFTPTGESPLARSKELKERTEKIFGEGWTPETDTLDVFVDSSWYFLRYTDPKNNKEFASKKKMKMWMPVDRYSGGAEHTTVHLLYSRFFHKALNTLGLVNEDEPYLERFNRGLILDSDGRKMSKRWGNVINPDEHVERVGADAVRMYLCFIGPYNKTGSYPWSTNGLVGVRRFLERVFSVYSGITAESRTSGEVETELHRTIKKVGEDIESFKFNTAISQMMILLNTIQKERLSKKDAKIFLQLLAPFAPHLAEELWHRLGNTTSIHLEPWPEYDESKLLTEHVSIAVQIDGKTRGLVKVPANSEEDIVVKSVKADERLSSFLKGKEVRRIVYVKNKLINLVLL
ncbi:class I tRNA ligase family protein, partial [Candidatus Kaiserbacteria bacterium]|nr:class I tRNA ligase family protein [Candidatus Kaiserbacteria bacterium]